MASSIICGELPIRMEKSLMCFYSVDATAKSLNASSNDLGVTGPSQTGEQLSYWGIGEEGGEAI